MQRHGMDKILERTSAIALRVCVSKWCEHLIQQRTPEVEEQRIAKETQTSPTHLSMLLRWSGHGMLLSGSAGLVSLGCIKAVFCGSLCRSLCRARTLYNLATGASGIGYDNEIFLLEEAYDQRHVLDEPRRYLRKAAQCWSEKAYLA